MKKSKIESKDIIKDIDNTLNIINRLENMDLDNFDIGDFKKEIEKQEKYIKNKYKNLDSKK